MGSHSEWHVLKTHKDAIQTVEGNSCAFMGLLVISLARTDQDNLLRLISAVAPGVHKPFTVWKGFSYSSGQGVSVSFV